MSGLHFDELGHILSKRDDCLRVGWIRLAYAESLSGVGGEILRRAGAMGVGSVWLDWDFVGIELEAEGLFDTWSWIGRDWDGDLYWMVLCLLATCCAGSDNSASRFKPDVGSNTWHVPK